MVGAGFKPALTDGVVLALLDEAMAALAMNARMGAKPWEAHTQYDYACLLLARGQPGNREGKGTLRPR